MSVLTDAMEAAEARKVAILGEIDSPTYSIADEFGRSAILGGFDIDMNELTEIADRVGWYFARFIAGSPLSLREASATTWMDGLLVGMMLGQAKVKNDNDI